MPNGIKPPDCITPGQTWTHRATGNQYTVERLVLMKKGTDWYHGVLYRTFAPKPGEDVLWYVRQVSEFLERFDKVMT